LLREAEVETNAMDGREIGFGTAALTLKDALERGDRPDYEADILAALAFEYADLPLLLLCVRRRERRNEGGEGNTEKCRKTHGLFSACELSAGGQEGSAVSKTRRDAVKPSKLRRQNDGNLIGRMR
jgi:hypothetical protein